jgi:hypothetical protein
MSPAKTAGLTVETHNVVADFAKLAVAGMASALAFAATASAIVLLLSGAA